METIGYVVTKSKTKSYEVKWNSEASNVWIDTKPISEGFEQICKKCYSKENTLKCALNFVNARENKF